MDDEFNIERFLEAQNLVFDTVLQELMDGEKRTHWMWYVFPQIAGLGYSSTSIFYAIASTDEAAAYLAHPVLGSRLRECCKILLGLEGVSAFNIFGFIDEQKLFASMTLFACVADNDDTYQAVLDKYFDGLRHRRTLELLGT
jgi:uncharacterized protein (DUF1810 family)